MTITDGLVEAKAFAVSSIDVIGVFFDDDIILEKEYLKMIEETLKCFEIIGAMELLQIILRIIFLKVNFSVNTLWDIQGSKI